MDLENLQQVAVDAAHAAGRIQRDHFGRTVKLQKSSLHDVTLEVDTLCERAIVGKIKDAFPDHGVLAEESGRANSDADWLWIIDPLDGSVNYFHGIPHFCVSIACYRRNGAGGALSPVLGLVYAPMRDELFLGAEGAGASLNGQPIRVNADRSVSEAVIGISFGSNEYAVQRMERLNAVLVRKVRKIRIFGSTALDLAQIACGRISGLVQAWVRDWDFAAARVVLEQSGGCFEARPVDQGCWEILAAEPGIFDEFKRLVSEAWT